MKCVAIFVSSYLFLLAPGSAQDDGRIAFIRDQAKKSDSKFEAITAKYNLTVTISPKIVEEADFSLSVRKSTVEGIWFRERYATKAVHKNTMGDGSKNEHTNIFAFNGQKTYQNQNFKNGVVLPVRVADEVVNPRFVAAPFRLAQLGTMSEILDFNLEKAPYGGPMKFWKDTQYRYLGEEKNEKLHCFKIEVSRLFPDPPGRAKHRSVLWIAPDRNWQIVASKNFVSPNQDEPNRIGRVSAWKEVKKGVWIPARAETSIFGFDKTGERIEMKKQTYQLVSYELKCDPKDKRFNDVGFLPSMKVRILDPIKDTVKELPIK